MSYVQSARTIASRIGGRCNNQSHSASLRNAMVDVLLEYILRDGVSEWTLGADRVNLRSQRQKKIMAENRAKASARPVESEPVPIIVKRERPTTPWDWVPVFENGRLRYRRANTLSPSPAPAESAGDKDVLGHGENEKGSNKL